VFLQHAPRLEKLINNFSHCPEKVIASLAHFGSQVTVEKSISSQHDPIIRVAYEPSAPLFTIRDIMSAISTSKSPPFDVTIHKPPSFEDRARSVGIQERRHLLIRLIFTIAVAIPTLVIGIVYMSLVSKTNATRLFFMKQMWAGNASRAQWSLFFLATPVMFFSAGIFHRRGAKEIIALWRKGSKTPIWKRFIRFGSMNLLVRATQKIVSGNIN